jgi:hypothetical protein
VITFTNTGGSAIVVILNDAVNESGIKQKLASLFYDDTFLVGVNLNYPSKLTSSIADASIQAKSPSQYRRNNEGRYYMHFPQLSSFDGYQSCGLQKSTESAVTASS